MTAITGAYGRVCGTATRFFGNDLLLFVARIGIAAVFFLSGRTKVDGLLTVTDTTLALFETEYALPWVDPAIAAHAATYAEHLFPALLVMGMLTRLSALALLAMTSVIQLFVYPDAWATHLTWAAILLTLIGRGPGGWSLDHRLGLEGRISTIPQIAGRLPRG